MKLVKSKGTIAVLVALAMVTAACGNRLTHAQVLAQNVVGVETGPAAKTGTAGSGAVGDTGTAATGTAATGSTGAGATAGGANGGAGDTGAVAAGGTGGGVEAVAVAKGKIVIGLVGYLSGLGGATLAPARDAWTAWAAMVNARGGISGHPVELLVGDDGGNASRSVAIARDFVENKGAIALTYAGSGLPFADYAIGKRIPVIGSVLGYTGWNSNATLFPPASAAQGTSYGIVRALKDAGVTKMANMYCAEAPDCKDGADRIAVYAKQLGVEVTYQAAYSVVAPDYTADCLQMKSRGVQGVYPSGDTASMIRMAQSCGRQGFNPIWVTPTASDELAGLPEFDRAISISTTFPWFLRSGSPALDEYGQALRTYSPGIVTQGDTFQTNGWISAKILEAAAAFLSDTPTSDDMLNALWQLQGDDLNGLAPGPTAIRYTREQPTPDVLCAYAGRVQGGQWTAPVPLQPVCSN